MGRDGSSNEDSGANSSYSSSGSIGKQQEQVATARSASLESSQAEKASLPPSKNDIDSVSVITTGPSAASNVAQMPAQLTGGIFFVRDFLFLLQ